MKTSERAIIIFILLLLAPVLFFLIGLLGQEADYPSIISLRRTMVMGKTILFGFAVAVFVVAISWMWAYLLFQQLGLKKYVIISLVLWMLMPPVIHAYLWMQLSHQFLGIGALSGGPISVMVQTLYFVPLGTVIWYVFFAGIYDEYYDVGYLNQAYKTAVYRVTMVMSRNLFGLLVGLFFVLSMMDYAIPSIFAFNTYPIEVMTVFASTFKNGPAFFISLPMMMVSLLVFIGLVKVFRVEAFEMITGGFHERRIPRGKRPYVIGIIMWLVMFIFPMFVLLSQLIKMDHVMSSINPYWSEILFSLVTACVASFIIVTISSYLYYHLVIKPKFRLLLWVVLILLFATPGTISGIIINGFYLKLMEWIPLLDGLYYSALPIIHVYVIRFMPIGFLMVSFGLRTLNPNLIKQGRLYDSGSFKVILESLIKPRFEYLLSSFFVVTVLCIGELAATIMVLPPGKSTLTVTIYNYLHYGSTETAALLCLMMMLLIGLFMGIGFWGYKRKKVDHA